MPPVLYIVVPCYNEEKVLPITVPLFRQELALLREAEKIGQNSRVLLVNDGSKDGTWPMIQEFSKRWEDVEGVSLSRNRGHQNALLGGLMEAKNLADITISIDADGQDDIRAMEAMVDAYHDGCDIVYGVRRDRSTDTAFKRSTAQGYYKLLSALGADVVYNHADYRLVSRHALEAFSQFGEVNLFLRGMFPMVGFKSTSVFYERHARLAGESHYPLRKMLALAFDGITSLSTKPLRIITMLGLGLSFVSFLLILYVLISYFTGNVVPGWASSVLTTALLGGIQLISLGVIGEYVGKIYLETKHRPRYLISERTWQRAEPDTASAVPDGTSPVTRPPAAPNAPSSPAPEHAKTEEGRP